MPPHHPIGGYRRTPATREASAGSAQRWARKPGDELDEIGLALAEASLLVPMPGLCFDRARANTSSAVMRVVDKDRTACR
jgi:hypothetical protein